MLPNRMQLNKQTEEQLKRLKANTGITPNVAARLAFFRSVETNFRYHPDHKKLDGNLILDKITWLGDTLVVTELTLQMIYPNLDHKEWIKAWAAHVEDGISSLRNHRKIHDLAHAI